MIENISDSINNAANQINGVSSQDTISYWFWIALIELIIIVLILIVKKRGDGNPQNNREQLKKDAQNGTIDFGNIINSSFNSRQLYDELKIKCHPDLFVDDNDKNEFANYLFQEISKNKTDYKRLVELKQKATEILKIKF